MIEHLDFLIRVQDFYMRAPFITPGSCFSFYLCLILGICLLLLLTPNPTQNNLMSYQVLCFHLSMVVHWFRHAIFISIIIKLHLVLSFPIHAIWIQVSTIAISTDNLSNKLLLQHLVIVVIFKRCHLLRYHIRNR
uniref:Uncharacterized protein n=1 Tax=Arundo donax TaxID=35708 RepID=A0A0A9CY34_ARUDO